MLVTLYLVKTSSDLTLGVDGDKHLEREQLHFIFESQKLKGKASLKSFEDYVVAPWYLPRSQ
jgi:hypothetical protein